MPQCRHTCVRRLVGLLRYSSSCIIIYALLFCTSRVAFLTKTTSACTRAPTTTYAEVVYNTRFVFSLVTYELYQQVAACRIFAIGRRAEPSERKTRFRKSLPDRIVIIIITLLFSLRAASAAAGVYVAGCTTIRQVVIAYR